MRHRSITILVLLGAFGLAVAACGDDDPPATSPSSTATPAASPTTSSSGPSSESELVVTELQGGATYLTGRIDTFSIDEGTLETDADGVQHSRNGTVGYRLVTDDPRVSGTVDGTWDTDRWGVITDGAMMQWGTATLTNENGTWEGDYAGAFASPVGDIITRWWKGTGDYEGLTFYMWIVGSEPGVPQFDVEGIIFPGDPPPTVTD